MGAFEDFMVLEMSRRSALLNPVTAGYDGDPNDGGAPSIFANSPPTTYYRQETPNEIIWYKETSGLWVVAGSGSSGGFTTAEDITVDIDPASAVPTPTPGTIFVNQAEIDAYLTANGGTAFKYGQDFVDVLPQIVLHNVTVNLLAGVHRPRALNIPLINLDGLRIDPAIITFQGASLADWTVVHAGGTIRAHQTFDEVTGVADPYVDCDALTFPNDGSLRGRIAVFDNGYYSQIWDHDDSRLWLNTTITPIPVDDTTTVEIREPATIFRQSLDDLARSHHYGVHATMVSAQVGPGCIAFNDILYQDFSASIPFYLTESRYDVERVIIDKQYGPVAENGGGYRSQWNGLVVLKDCSYVSTVGGGSDGCMASADATGILYPQRCYFQGGDDGNVVNGFAWIYACVFRGGGGGPQHDSLYSWEGGSISLLNFGFGVINTILDTVAGASGLSLHGDVVTTGFQAMELRVKDVAGDGIRLYTNGTLDLTVTNNVIDAGGISGAGIRLTGPGAKVIVSDNVTISGAEGDIKFHGGDVWSYAQIAGFGPVIDEAMNYAEKV